MSEAGKQSRRYPVERVIFINTSSYFKADYLDLPLITVPEVKTAGKVNVDLKIDSFRKPSVMFAFVF